MFKVAARKLLLLTQSNICVLIVSFCRNEVKELESRWGTKIIVSRVATSNERDDHSPAHANRSPKRLAITCCMSSNSWRKDLLFAHFVVCVQVNQHRPPLRVRTNSTPCAPAQLGIMHPKRLLCWLFHKINSNLSGGTNPNLDCSGNQIDSMKLGYLYTFL
jgi:hypothetical protein